MCVDVCAGAVLCLFLCACVCVRERGEKRCPSVPVHRAMALPPAPHKGADRSAHAAAVGRRLAARGEAIADGEAGCGGGDVVDASAVATLGGGARERHAALQLLEQMDRQLNAVDELLRRLHGGRAGLPEPLQLGHCVVWDAVAHDLGEPIGDVDGSTSAGVAVHQHAALPPEPEVARVLRVRPRGGGVEHRRLLPRQLHRPIVRRLDVANRELRLPRLGAEQEALLPADFKAVVRDLVRRSLGGARAVLREERRHERQAAHLRPLRRQAWRPGLARAPVEPVVAVGRSKVVEEVPRGSSRVARVVHSDAAREIVAALEDSRGDVGSVKVGQRLHAALVVGAHESARDDCLHPHLEHVHKEGGDLLVAGAR
mmetsp:Transcript_15819/g.37532  ORF Transcript_15819/g.37532 Transcript_15819/m.37532 type:complete len:371 (-) Transcript_15819:1193-2305(-)